MKRNYGNKQVYFVGGGLASMAGAIYLLRDCGFSGKNIHILEGMSKLGGSNDGAGNAVDGFICRGGRMLNEETYENTWDLFSSIPSLDYRGKTLCDEILNFDHSHPTHAKARLVDKNGRKINVRTMGFHMSDRLALLKLMLTPEAELDNLSISDWFKHTPHFFETNFWYMWQTTFAFQKWSSLFEFKRYMKRMIFEFSRIETLEGVTRTPYNQYDSIIVPIKKVLDRHHVDFSLKYKVTDISFEKGKAITASAIHYENNGKKGILHLNKGDICIVTNGCMTDNATLGSFHKAAEMVVDNPLSASLWRNIANKKPGLGNPEPFFGKPSESNWESFTVTCKGNMLLKMIEKFTGNVAGSGALMTFKDSNWLMSTVVAHQPHFKNQPSNTTVFWGYGLYTDRIGDYVKKPMKDCTGEEILTELLYHLHFENKKDEIMKTVVNVIPCMMPYTDAQFQPRAMRDRPYVVPKGSTNFAMISQFVEIPEDMVFTEEYSIRAARIAVYTLFNIKKRICPVTPHAKRIRTLIKAVHTSFR